MTANRFLARLKKSVNRLRILPESGWRVEGAEDRDYLEIVFQQYRIIYRFDGIYVEIVTVVRGSRDIRKRLP